ncbi:HTTM domain-containing protein [Leucobacter luti]|nr:HTTM domain-containing protein [Leucobacter luti]
MTRILIGVIGLGLLASNFATRLYSFGPGSAWSNEHTDPQSDLSALPVLALFRAASLNASLYTVLYIALMALAVLVVLGWRTRAILFMYGALWVSFIEANDLLGDQGDNMYRIILILLLFTQSSAVLSLDARRRSKAVAAARRTWVRGKNTSLRELSNLLHNLALVVLACQVFFVYVSGALYKTAGLPWQNGTAIYDPLATDRFGSWPWISELLTANASMVAVLTWSSILLQLAFPFMLLSAPTRRFALVGIWCFHVGIGVLMGLPWFSLTMIAVDFIFVRDVSWLTLNRRIRATARHVRCRVVAE